MSASLWQELSIMRASQAICGRPTTREIGAWFAQYIDGVTMRRALAAPRRGRGGRFVRLTQFVATISGVTR